MLVGARVFEMVHPIPGFTAAVPPAPWFDIAPIGRDVTDGSCRWLRLK